MRYTVIVVALLLVMASVGLAQTVTVGGPSGSLEIPKDWELSQSADTLHAWSTDVDSSWVLIHIVPDAEWRSYLRAAARERSISDYVRSTSGDFAEDARADRGGFVLGTVPLDVTAEALPDPAGYDDLSPTWVADEGKLVPARYRIVAAYQRGSDLYVLEGESRRMRGKPMMLSSIHRSWVLPR